MSQALLEVRDLRVGFQTDHGLLEAVDGVSFAVEAGKTLGLVGESGCGKSVTARALMRLLEQPSGRVLGGEVLLKGHDILKLDLEEMRNIRGNEIAMIFQEPMSALNPVHRVGKQIVENIRLHQKLGPQAALKRAVELMEWVGIPAPDKRINEYPHQLSGGMRQRVMIAMALSCNPRILIADEPTTALDVTVQAQILDLINRLQKETGMAVILITHDLGVVAETCDEVAVMYAGRLVERASVQQLFAHPRHAYTRGLLNSIPAPDTAPKTLLKTIPGSVPSIRNYIQGSRFAARLGIELTPEQKATRPPFTEIEPGHWVENCPFCIAPDSAQQSKASNQSGDPVTSSSELNHENQSEAAPSKTLAAARAFLERSAGTTGTPRSREERVSERNRQLQLLVEYAKQQGLLIAAEQFNTPETQGAEHRIYYDEKTGRALKLTNPGKCGMAFPDGEADAALPTEYLKRWELHNQLFGDDVEFHGVVQAPSGICLVVSQRWIEGERPDATVIKQFLSELNFTPTSRAHDYYRSADGTAVLDSHEDNWIQAADGWLFAIDVIPVQADEGTKKALGVMA